MKRFLWIVLLTVFIGGCSSSVPPVETEGEEVISLEENYTVVWNIPYVRGEAGFNLEIHQHNQQQDTFRFKLETAVPDYVAFEGMLETPITRTLTRGDAITANETLQTDWINYETDRTLCWFISGNVDDVDVALEGCLGAEDIKFPPQASSWKGNVSRVGDGLIAVWLMEDGDGIDASLLIQMPETQEHTGLRGGMMKLGSSVLELPPTNNDEFQLLDADAQPCLEVMLEYGAWDVWEKYFADESLELTTCLP